MGIKVVATGIGMADKVITNADFEKILDTSDEWIKTRTGIEERRFVSDEQTNETLATEAAVMAMEKSGIDVSDISLVIAATFSPSTHMPSIASRVAKNISLCEESIVFDLNTACTGFVTALNVAHSMLADMKDKYALIIGSEVLSKFINFEDRGTAVLFGDGAGAAIIKRDDSLDYCYLSGYVHDSGNVLHTIEESSLIAMEGKQVFRFATEKMNYSINEILKRACKTADDIDLFVPHQANKRIIDHVVKKQKIDPAKFAITLDKFGNTSAASVPMTLALQENIEGKKIVCVGFGGGLTYGAILING